MAVAPTTLFSSSFSVIYNLINNNVTDPIASTKNTSPSTKWVFSAYPDADIEAKKIKYPIIIIDPIDIVWENFTFSKNMAGMLINITIYSNTASQLDTIFDSINAVMNGQRPYLKAQGITEVKLDSSSTDFVMHSGTRVHFRNSTFSGKYYFSSGLSKTTLSNTIQSAAVVTA